MKKRRISLFPVLVSAFMILFSLWFYTREGPYKQVMNMNFVPTECEFKLEILAEGMNVELYMPGREAVLTVEKEVLADQSALWIEGGISEMQIGKPISLQFAADTEDEQARWEIRPIQGLTSSSGKVNVMKNQRGAYVGFSCLLVLVLWLLLARPLSRKRQKEIPGYAADIFERLKNENHGTYYKDGLAYYHTFTKRIVMEKMSEAALLWIMVLWFFREIYQPYVWKRFLLFLVTAVVATLVFCCRNVHRSRILIAPLIKENRPLSTASALLTEGFYGIGGRKLRSISIYNAAVCLHRGGWDEEALSLSKLADEMAGAYKGSYFVFQRAVLRQKCYLKLGLEKEASREALKMEIMLEEHASLRKDKEVRLRLLAVKMTELVSAGEWVQAEETCQEYLDRCRDDYHRLVAFSSLASVKERLGKTEEAAALRKKTLTFSPENRVVQDTMIYGPCTYVNDRIKYRDCLGILLSGVYIVLAAVLVILLSSKVSPYLGTPLEGSVVQSEGVREVTLPEEVVVEAPSEELKEKSKEPKESTLSEPAENIEETPAAEFSIEFPNDWKGRYVEKRLDNGGMIVFQRSSYEKMGDGMLFAISIYDNGDYINEPDYEILGYDGARVYAMLRPTDVAFYWEDDNIREEYQRMDRELEAVKASFCIESASARYDGDEFIFPNSGEILLQEADLWNISTQNLRIARNEIYARHGRLFKDAELQRYFDGCSWYQGRIEPDAFSDTLLNEYEIQNIRLIQREQGGRE